MHIPFPPEDPHELYNWQYLVKAAMESFLPNGRIVGGQVSISCTANVLASQGVTFKDASGKNQLPFLKGTTPFIIPFVNPSTTSSVVTPSLGSITNSGFTAQVYSNTTQSVTFYYIAIGQSQ